MENHLSTLLLKRVLMSTQGMDIAQFGSSSSYARKYAMNGMFLIDDMKDADATNTHGRTTTSTSKSNSDSEWLASLSSTSRVLKTRRLKNCTSK